MRRLLTLLAFLGSIAVADAPAQGNAAQALPLIGLGSGGTAFTRQCPAGQVLTGLRVRAGLVIDALGIKCRPVNANGSLGGENDIGSFTGGSGGVSSSGSCPQGSVVMGQHGTSMMPTGLAMFSLECRRWDAAERRWTGSPTAAIRVLTGSSGPVGLAVLLNSAAVTTAFTRCSRATQPVVLLRGRAAAVIDAAGTTCNEP
jgi:hypothetical protein